MTLGKLIKKADLDPDIASVISKVYGLLSNKDFVRHGGVEEQRYGTIGREVLSVLRCRCHYLFEGTNQCALNSGTYNPPLQADTGRERSWLARPSALLSLRSNILPSALCG